MVNSSNSSLSYNKNNNFNLIRLIAAIAVFIHHIHPIYFKTPMSFDIVKFLIGNTMGHMAVNVFFLISGYLVLQSYLMHSKMQFIKSRFLRIMPAYIVVLFFTVFIIGALASNLNLHDYYSNTATYKYLLNCNPFRINYTIPSVFTTNPIPTQVNNSIWTIPFEITCYIILFILGAIRGFKYKYVLPVFWGVLIIAYYFVPYAIDTTVIPILDIECNKFFSYFMYFLTGMLFYQYRTKIYYHWIVCIIVLILCILFNKYVVYAYCCYVMIAYILFYIALKIPIHIYNKYMKHDYSYGFYLYAFPIQQLLAMYYQQHKIAYINSILVSFVLTSVCAILSWHLIEKPFLKLKYK